MEFLQTFTRECIEFVYIFLRKIKTFNSDLSEGCLLIFFLGVHSTTARVLMLMVIPGHLVFTYGIRFFNAGHTSVTAMFLTFYLLAAVIQV